MALSHCPQHFTPDATSRESERPAWLVAAAPKVEYSPGQSVYEPLLASEQPHLSSAIPRMPATLTIPSSAWPTRSGTFVRRRQLRLMR
jgi:hypothetical protein